MFELVDRGDDAVVVGLRVSEPDWSGSAEVFKLFTFRPGTDVVVGIQDQADRDHAPSATGTNEG